MKRFSFLKCLCMVGLLCAGAWSQEVTNRPLAATSSVAIAVPRVIRVSGMVKDPDQKSVIGKADITFSLYKDQEGGPSLWTETQNVTLDNNGKYNVLLGASTTEGLPSDLFASSEARWLGVHVQGTGDQPRTLLLSVPYALKALDAETLGGKPASAFLTAAQLRNADADSKPGPRSATGDQSQKLPPTVHGDGTTSINYLPMWTAKNIIDKSVVFQSGTNISIGGTAAAAKEEIAVSGEGVLALRLDSGPNSFLDVTPTNTGGRFQTVFNTVNNRDFILLPGTGRVGIGTSTPATTLQVAGSLFASSASSNAGTFVKGGSTIPSTLAALQVQNVSTSGEAGWFGNNNASNTASVIKLVNSVSTSTANFLECDRPDNTRKCHIDSNGTFVSGSDFAEALPARGERRLYEPGDVLVMARTGIGVEKTREGYSRRVIGIYSTRPGLLGAEKGGGESRVDSSDVPVAITGIVPTKVSAENGPIRVGDLLVSSPTLGYAMRATDSTRTRGAIVGKALQPLSAHKGVISVLVMLR